MAQQTAISWLREKLKETYDKEGKLQLAYTLHLVKQAKQMELPSDEEIERQSEVLYPINKGSSMWMPSRYDIDKANRQEGFLKGALWMKEQILNQNK